MDERLMQFRVGVMALATLIITAIMVLFVGKLPALVHGTYPVNVIFKDAPGVAEDTPVRKYGIRIGRVSHVGFAEDRDAAVVTVEIQSDIKLHTDEYCRLTNSLLGDAVLEFIDEFPDETPDTFIEPGDTIEGHIRSNPLDVIANLEDNMKRTLDSISGTANEIKSLAANVNDVITTNEGGINRVIAKTEQTLDELRGAVSGVHDLFQDPELKQNLTQAINDLPQVLTDAREAVTGLKNTLAGVDRNLANLEGLTKPLGERGGRLVANLERSTEKLDVVLTQLADFSDALNNPEGSLGQLLNDPHIYQQLNETVENINLLSRNLQPIVRDARRFSDGLARHGLRDLMIPRSGAKLSPGEMGQPLNYSFGSPSGPFHRP